MLGWVVRACVPRSARLPQRPNVGGKTPGSQEDPSQAPGRRENRKRRSMAVVNLAFNVLEARGCRGNLSRKTVFGHESATSPAARENRVQNGALAEQLLGSTCCALGEHSFGVFKLEPSKENLFSHAPGSVLEAPHGVFNSEPSIVFGSHACLTCGKNILARQHQQSSTSSRHRFLTLPCNWALFRNARIAGFHICVQAKPHYSSCQHGPTFLGLGQP